MADYSLPPWLQFDPAQRINQAIQSSRARRDQEQNQQFEQSRESDQDEMTHTQFAMQQQAAARKLAADMEFQQGIGALDKTSPTYQKDFLNLWMQHAAKTGVGTAGIGPAMNATKPAPTFQAVPGGDQSSPAPTAPTMPSAAPLQPPSMSLGTPPATPAPAAPAPAPAATPAPVPTQSFAHPAGFLGGKYIPAQFPPTPKPTPTPKPVVTRPGEVVLDPITQKPTYTNTTQLPSRRTDLAPRVVPPGGVVYDQGKPTFTNTAPRTVTGKSAEPIALPKSKDDLKVREVYQTSKGPAWWDGEQFHLLK